MKTLEIEQKKLRTTWTQTIPQGAKTVLKHFFMFIGGALFGSIQGGAILSPFGVAFTAAAPLPYILTAGMGAAAGYILTQDSVTSLRYIASLICAAILARTMHEFETMKKFRLLPSCISFLACFLSGMAVMFASEIRFSIFIVYLCEGGVAFVTSYFVNTSLEMLENRTYQNGFSTRDLVPILGTVFLCFLSLQRAAILGVSFSGIAVCLLIQICAYFYQEGGGTIAGLLAASAFSMDEKVGITASAYAFSGLFSGVFSYTGRKLSSAIFFGTFLAAYLLSGSGVSHIHLLIEGILATILWMIFPEKYIILIQNKILPQTIEPNSNAGRKAVYGRLKTATEAIDQIEKTVGIVNQTLEKNDTAEYNAALLRTQENICKSCGRYEYCWNKHFSDTIEDFKILQENLQNNRPLQNGNVPPNLASRCIRLTSLLEYYEKNHLAVSARVAAEERITEIRAVTADQFGGIRDMLRELAEEFSEKIQFDTALAEQILDALQNHFDFKIQNISCFRTAEGRIFAELELETIPNTMNLAELRNLISEICDRTFDLPSFRDNKTMCFCERTSYAVEMATAQIPAISGDECGDSYQSFYDGKGNYIVILSDGMGTGPRAAVDSILASGLMTELTKAGFGFESALRLVNGALLLKSKEESLATLDILKINLFTGKAKFYKAGAAASIIKRKDKLYDVKKAALPAGILRNATFASCEGTLQDGDVVVLASDGAFEYTGKALHREISTIDTKNMEFSVHKVAESVKTAKGEHRCDDITVIGLLIKKQI